MTDAKTLTLALGGRWHGAYGLAFCPAHDNTRTPALSLADGEGGRLLAHCHAGCAFADIIDALKRRGLVDGCGDHATSHRDHDRVIAKARAEDQKRRADQAHRLWREAGPVAGALAERYLRARGVTCALPETLRFHPACWHQSGVRLPALLALVEGGDDFAVHRTYLGPDALKASVDPAKAMLGPCAGGAVHLSASEGPLVVAEGVETALSLLSGLLREPSTVWAALSTSGVKALRLPPEPGRLIITPDGDPAGKAAAHDLAGRANALGWAVSLLPAPEGRDWNDVIRRRSAA